MLIVLTQMPKLLFFADGSCSKRRARLITLSCVSKQQLIVRAFTLYWVNTNFSRSCKYNRFRITKCRKGNEREVLLGLIRKEMAEPVMGKAKLNDSSHEKVSLSFFRR